METRASGRVDDDRSTNSFERRATHRRRRVIGALLAVAVVVVWMVVARYQPLVPGSKYGVNVEDGVQPFERIDTRGSLPDQVIVLPDLPGQTFTERFTIRNDGWRAVTIEGVRAYADDDSTVELRVEPGYPKPDFPFRPPYALGPSEELSLVIRYRIAPCADGKPNPNPKGSQTGGATGWDSHQVSFKTFGFISKSVSILSDTRIIMEEIDPRCVPN